MPALLSIILGLGLGRMAKGRVGNLTGLRLRFELPVIVVFALQAVARGRVLGMIGATHLGLAVWVTSTLILAGLLAANWRLPGLAVGSFGALLNTVVVLANGAMPVAIGTFRSTTIASKIASAAGFYKIANPATVMPWLGDAMTVPTAFGHVVLVSAGDVLLMVGVVAVMTWAMTAEFSPGSAPQT